MQQEVLLCRIVVLILGLVFLVKGSDFFVKSAAAIAKKLGVSEFIIGLTLVAMGTSIPELASSVAASLKQQSDIVIGNIVGSNIANIGLIIGLAATIAVIKTREEMLKRDGSIMLFATLVLYLVIIDGRISRGETVIFLLLYLAYIMLLFKEKPNKDISPNEPKSKAFRAGFAKECTILILSGSAVIFGAHYLIAEAVFFAEYFHISKTCIGISLVAVGTSLPELGVSVSAARNGYGDIAVANVIGSNIANIFLILGVSAFIFPLSIQRVTLQYIAPFMIVMTMLLLIFIRSEWELRRIEGAAFLVLYAAFITFIFLMT